MHKIYYTTRPHSCPSSVFIFLRGLRFWTPKHDRLIFDLCLAAPTVPQRFRVARALRLWPVLGSRFVRMVRARIAARFGKLGTPLHSRSCWGRVPEGFCYLVAGGSQEAPRRRPRIPHRSRPGPADQEAPRGPRRPTRTPGGHPARPQAATQDSDLCRGGHPGGSHNPQGATRLPGDCPGLSDLLYGHRPTKPPNAWGMPPRVVLGPY